MKEQGARGKGLVERLLRRRLEPDWQAERRRRAWDACQRLAETEDLRGRRSGAFPPGGRRETCPDEGVGDLHSFFCTKGMNSLVFADDQIVVHHLEPDLAKRGVLFTDLSLAVRTFPSRVRPYLGQVAPGGEKWAALNEALWNAGAFLYVPRGVKVELPLHVWWHRTAAGGELHPRLLVVAGEQSEVTLLLGETSRVVSEAFSVQVVEVVAKQGAQVHVAAVSEQDAAMARVTYLQADVRQGARVDWLYSEVGAGVNVVRARSLLQEEGAGSRLDGVGIGHGRQHVDLTMTALHVGQHTESRMRVHALLADESCLISQAVTQIEPGAVGTKAAQEERLMLLSPHAQARPVPMLLLAEEDVTCRDAVSVGRLDEESLYYLMSRGIGEEEAKRLLLAGFLTPLFDGVPVRGLREMTEAWVGRKMRA